MTKETTKMREELEQKIHEFAVNAEVLYKAGYEEGYRAGYEGKCLLTEEECLADQKRQYERGLNDAWECIKKIAKMDIDTLNTVFNLSNYMGVSPFMASLIKYSASEAIAKIKEYEEKQKCKTCRNNEGKHHPFDSCNNCYDGSEYEEKQKQTDDEIKVGDEIIFSRDWYKTKAIITNINRENNTAVCLYVDGSDCAFVSANPSSLIKTGRHFTQIAEVLEMLKDKAENE